MKRILTILHCALTLALILVLLSIQRAPDPDPSVVPAMTAPEPVDVVDGKAHLAKDLILAKDQRIRELEEKLLAATAEETVAELPARIAASPRVAQSAFVSADREKSAQARRVANVERKFGDLFFELELSPEDSDKLRALLVAREGADDPTALDEEIEKFLGSEAYAYLEWYKETPKARATVKDIQHKLSTRGLGMTAEQAVEMVDIFHRTDTTGLKLGLPQTQSLGNGMMTIQINSGGKAPVDIEDGLDQLTTNFHQLLDDAEQVLAENQMEILTQILNQKLRRIESNVKSTAVGGAGIGATIRLDAAID